MKRFLPASALTLTGIRWFGLDLAKRESQLAVLDEKGLLVAEKRFCTTRENLLALAAELRPEDTIAPEVTTNATAIARLLRNNSPAKLIMSNPIKTKLIAHAKVKTDKVDARVLAELARVGYLPEVWLPDEDTESLRQFFSDRRSLVDRRTELKNTVHSVLHRNLIAPVQSDIFGTGGRAWLNQLIGQQLSLQITELDRLRLGSLLTEVDRQDALVGDQEAVIASFTATRPGLKKQLDLLVSIPGVSLIVGAGTKLKREIVRRAAEQSERIYRAMVSQHHQSKADGQSAEQIIRREDVIFDPTRPVQTDWETVLAKVAERLIAARKQKV